MRRRASSRRRPFNGFLDQASHVSHAVRHSSGLAGALQQGRRGAGDAMMAGLLLVLGIAAAAPVAAGLVDWPSFLARSDPVNTFHTREPMTLVQQKHSNLHGALVV